MEVDAALIDRRARVIRFVAARHRDVVIDEVIWAANDDCVNSVRLVEVGYLGLVEIDAFGDSQGTRLRYSAGERATADWTSYLHVELKAGSIGAIEVEARETLEQPRLLARLRVERRLTASQPLARSFDGVLWADEPDPDVRWCVRFAEIHRTVVSNAGTRVYVQFAVAELQTRLVEHRGAHHHSVDPSASG